MAEPALGPCVMEGDGLRLEPLRAEHALGLLATGDDPKIWRWMPRALVDRAAMEGFIADAVRKEQAGEAYAFAVVRRADGLTVGSTSYLNIEPAHRGVEVGWTFYSPRVWGGTVNPEAKYLLMRHAFEEWGALRVALRTDSRNLHSQAAIRKLGARYEGTLRSHRIRPDGTLRDTVVFSVVREEWPAVREGLWARLRSGTS